MGLVAFWHQAVSASFTVLELLENISTDVATAHTREYRGQDANADSEFDFGAAGAGLGTWESCRLSFL